MVKKFVKDQNIKTLGAIALLMVIIWLLTQISGSVFPLIATFLLKITPLILGMLFAFLLNPFVTSITNRFFHGRKIIGIIVTFIIIIALLVFVIYPIVTDIIVRLPEIMAYLSMGTAHLLDSISSINSDIKTQILEYVSAYSSNITQIILNSVNNIVSVSMQTFLTFIVMAFTLLEYDALIEKLTLLFKKDKRKTVVKYIAGLEQQLYAYLSSLVLGFTLSTLVFGLSLHFLAINNAWSFASIMSLLIVLIPVIGPFISTGILAIITLPIGTTPTIVGFVILAIFMQLFINVISPRIFARTLDLSNLLIIASFMIGFALLGISGALFAVPAVITILYTYHFFDTQQHWSEKR